MGGIGGGIDLFREIEGEFHIFDGERLAVVKGEVVPQFNGDGSFIKILDIRCRPVHRPSVFIQAHQVGRIICAARAAEQHESGRNN